MRPASIMVASLSLVACLPDTLPSASGGPFYGEDPVITELSWDCELDAGVWTLELETEGWTGGGRLYLSRDWTLVEDHPFYSEEAAGNGSWDRLKLELDVARDWTEASSGSSTAFRCADADELSAMVLVYEAMGNVVADCRVWGAEPEAWSLLEDTPSCDEVWSVADTGS